MSGKRRIFILTEEQTPSLRRTLARAFSPPLAPSFGEGREDKEEGREDKEEGREDKLRREDNNLTSQEARSVVFSP